MTVTVTGSVKHPHIVVPQSESGSFFAEHGDTVVDVVKEPLIQRAAAVGLSAVGFEDLVRFNGALGCQIPVAAVAQSGLEEDTQTDLFLIFKQSLEFAERSFLDPGLVVDVVAQRVLGVGHGIVGDARFFVTLTDQFCKIFLFTGKVGDDGNKEGFGEFHCGIHNMFSFILQGWVH